jgi:hypothetical protein
MSEKAGKLFQVKLKNKTVLMLLGWQMQIALAIEQFVIT